ncbi:helix-turn-helix domain-containing protein [Streptomyces sp. NPDC001381]|uniref:helix-turn-helix domain-containing protein n=1 Tax=Streptomyces sp. NPDC001381 TaxID=3364567 RepID=UPI00369C27AB
MSEPALSFVLRLRGLYEESGWPSLQAFAQAVGYSRGTISRFLSGERQPKARFLDTLFAALEDRTGRPVAEAVREETRRMYFESIRDRAPAEYRLFQMEEQLKAAQRELKQQLEERANAHDTEREALHRQVTELRDTLRHIEGERKALLQRCERSAEQGRAERERRQFLEQALAEVGRLQEGLVLTRPRGLPYHGPLTGLVLRARTGSAVALSPGGALIVSGGSDDTMRFWEPSAGQSPVRSLHRDRPVTKLDFHAGRRLLAAACRDGSTWLWRLAADRSDEPERLGSGIVQVRAVAFAPRPDGLLAIAGAGGRAVELWKAAPEGAAPGAPSRRARFLRDENGRPPPPGTRVGRFSGYRLYEGFGGLDGGVDALAFSPAADRLATAGADGTVRLWDLRAGTPVVGPLGGHEGSVRAIAFSPDGRRIATGGADGTVRLWDPVAASSGRPLTGHTGPVGCVAFSPDGRLVASAGDDATVRCWSTTTGRAVGEPLAGHEGPVTGLSFSRDGGLLSSAGTDRTVRLWPTPTA